MQCIWDVLSITVVAKVIRYDFSIIIIMFSIFRIVLITSIDLNYYILNAHLLCLATLLVYHQFLLSSG